MLHTVAVSDVHLCQSVPGEGLWMRHRQRRFFPDIELARMFDTVAADLGGRDSLAVVFNGDLFDFDAPPVIDGVVRYQDAPVTELEAVQTLGAILDDHDAFVSSLGRLVAQGHQLVFVAGNHDAQLAWPSVRRLLTERITRAAKDAGSDEDSGSLAARVVHRTWFYRTEDGIHIEHGNQYDPYCSFRFPMSPFALDGRIVQPTMGSLSFRFLAARMGYFNPHVDSSFLLTLPEYLAHWARYYLRSPHSLAVTWARGALRVTADVIRHRDVADRARATENVERCVAETGAPRSAVMAHTQLYALPSAERPHRVIRELWLDRVALAMLGTAVVGAGAFGGALMAGRLALGALGAIAAYEIAVPKIPLSATYERVAQSQREIARIHRAKAVLCGHTHVPTGEWERGVFYGNSGTWSAAFRDPECTQPIDDARPVIWLRSSTSGHLEGGLYRLRSGLAPVKQSERSPESSLTPFRLQPA